MCSLCLLVRTGLFLSVSSLSLYTVVTAFPCYILTTYHMSSFHKHIHYTEFICVICACSILEAWTETTPKAKMLDLVFQPFHQYFLHQYLSIFVSVNTNIDYARDIHHLSVQAIYIGYYSKIPVLHDMKISE